MQQVLAQLTELMGGHEAMSSIMSLSTGIASRKKMGAADARSTSASKLGSSCGTTLGSDACSSRTKSDPSGWEM